MRGVMRKKSSAKQWAGRRRWFNVGESERREWMRALAMRRWSKRLGGRKGAEYSAGGFGLSVELVRRMIVASRERGVTLSEWLREVVTRELELKVLQKRRDEP